MHTAHECRTALRSTLEQITMALPRFSAARAAADSATQ